MLFRSHIFDGVRVALLTEGVDRNTGKLESMTRKEASPSSRRAWIEMWYNHLNKSSRPRRPPHGGRG